MFVRFGRTGSVCVRAANHAKHSYCLSLCRSLCICIWFSSSWWVKCSLYIYSLVRFSFGVTSARIWIFHIHKSKHTTHNILLLHEIAFSEAKHNNNWMTDSWAHDRCMSSSSSSSSSVEWWYRCTAWLFYAKVRCSWFMQINGRGQRKNKFEIIVTVAELWAET